jgi:hypothetical protein
MKDRKPDARESAPDGLGEEALALIAVLDDGLMRSDEKQGHLSLVDMVNKVAKSNREIVVAIDRVDSDLRCIVRLLEAIAGARPATRNPARTGAKEKPVPTDAEASTARRLAALERLRTLPQRRNEIP